MIERAGGTAWEENIVAEIETEGASGDQIRDDGFESSTDEIDIVLFRWIAVGPAASERVRGRGDTEGDRQIEVGKHAFVRAPNGDSEVGGERE